MSGARAGSTWTLVERCGMGTPTVKPAGPANEIRFSRKQKQKRAEKGKGGTKGQTSPSPSRRRSTDADGTQTGTSQSGQSSTGKCDKGKTLLYRLCIYHKGSCKKGSTCATGESRRRQEDKERIHLNRHHSSFCGPRRHTISFSRNDRKDQG